MHRRAPWFVLIALAVVLAAGLMRLFFFRFEQGDIYPPYSTLRTDPIGCRVLYDSLSELPGLDVTRHHDTLDQIVAQPTPSLILAGTDLFGWGIRYSRNAETLTSLLASGSRIVVAMRPQGASLFTNDIERLNYRTDEDEEEDAQPPWPFDKFSKTNKPSAQSPTNAVASTNENAQASTNAAASTPPKIRHRGNTNFITCVNGSCARFISWGFEVNVDWSNRLDKLPPVAHRTPAAPSALPEEIPCHTHASFTNLAPAWTVLYERAGRPVLIERPFHGGTLVILADAYALSNEAMLKDRSASLAAWLVGPHKRIIFDESHHGIAITTSFGDLAKKYGLAGLLLGLFALFAAYIWLSAVPLLPRQTDTNIADTRVSGRDSAAGLINLLRRNIPPKTLLSECLTAWETTHPEATPARRAEIRRLATNPDPVGAANQIATAIAPHTSKHWKKGAR